MIAFYAQIKFVHIAAVLVSGLLFLFRGVLVQAGRERLAMAAPVRYLSYTVDTVLLTAALMLVTILPGALFANGWLWAKIILLVAYILFGALALKRAQTARARLLSFVAALGVYGLMLSIARAHHPLGVLHWLLQQ
ncbi:SirB2 family protein [Tahibacter amnicola]|uniref:SirB2 family protein n=1 Tax=Tahibacter amnicola TaxID=2976241 RepID=A0ABY6B929_9GAMM|nr:SirB2 family protein [Tahibacter amnicola]UXI66578.1 SirB2 family protein [Tahibacter amnicola]